MPFPDHCLHLRFCLHVFSFHYIANTSATTAKTAYKDDNIIQKLKIFVKPQDEIARQKCRYGMQKLKIFVKPQDEIARQKCRYGMLVNVCRWVFGTLD